MSRRVHHEPRGIASVTVTGPVEIPTPEPAPVWVEVVSGLLGVAVLGVAVVGLAVIS